MQTSAKKARNRMQSALLVQSIKHVKQISCFEQKSVALHVLCNVFQNAIINKLSPCNLHRIRFHHSRYKSEFALLSIIFADTVCQLFPDLITGIDFLFCLSLNFAYNFAMLFSNPSLLFFFSFPFYLLCRYLF